MKLLTLFPAEVSKWNIKKKLLSYSLLYTYAFYIFIDMNNNITQTKGLPDDGDYIIKSGGSILPGLPYYYDRYENEQWSLYQE